MSYCHYSTEFINTAALQMISLMCQTYLCTYETTGSIEKCPYKYSDSQHEIYKETWHNV